MKAARILVAAVVLVAMLVAPATALAQAEDWLVRLSLTTNPNVGIVPGTGFTFAFGARDGATEGFSAAEGDQVAAPDPMQGVTAYFYYPDNLAFQRNLVTSVVGREATITWPLLVKSVGDPGAIQATLTWDAQDIGNVPAKYGVLELRDTAGNTLANMRTAGSYTFALLSNETRNFHIVAEEVPTYALTMAVAPPGSGTATDLTNASPYAAGTPVTIGAVAAAGYRFVNWTAPAGAFVNANAAETTFTMPPQAVTVTANFVAVYPLAMAASPALGGTATDLTSGSPYTSGTQVSIRAVAAAGYRFVNWTAPAGAFVNANAPQTTFTMPPQAVTVTANFVAVYALNMAVAPPGGGTATDLTNASPYTAGSQVNIRAVAAAGYRFVNWTAPAGVIANPNAAQTIFTMPGQAVTVTANLEKIPSVATATGTGTAYFEASQGTIGDLDLVALREIPPNPPAGFTFPHGMFSFKIMGLTSGQTVDVTITLPLNVEVGTVWWKYDNGQWDSLPNLNDNGDNIMVIRLTDGGTGDLDSIPGQITDPGGPGAPLRAVGGTAYPVSRLPILASWIALAAVVSGMSLLALRRRRAQG